MASEIRHILFQPMEIVQALGHYYRRVGRPVPSGVVVRCRTDGGMAGVPLRFKITLTPDSPYSTLRKPRAATPAVEFSVVVEEADLTAALILACRTLKIPLPSKSGKTVQAFGEQIGLVFTMAAPKLELGPNERLML
jgi:hypothetical protein